MRRGIRTPTNRVEACRAMPLNTTRTWSGYGDLNPANQHGKLTPRRLGFIRMVPPERFELPARRFEACCSSTELRRYVRRRQGQVLPSSHFIHSDPISIGLLRDSRGSYLPARDPAPGFDVDDEGLEPPTFTAS